jgi:hypothetical protein
MALQGSIILSFRLMCFNCYALKLRQMNIYYYALDTLVQLLLATWSDTPGLYTQLCCFFMCMSLLQMDRHDL